MDDTGNRQWDEEVIKYLQMTIAELQAELDLCMGYLIYRVERDLYEVIADEGISDLSWESLHSQLKWNEPLRTASAVVLSQGIFELTESDYFDDDNPGHELDFLDDMEEDTLHYTRIFPDEIGRAFLRILVLRGQAFRYARQVENGEEQTWKQFLNELNTNAKLWQELSHSLINALRHLNFKSAWMNWDLEEYLFEE